MKKITVKKTYEGCISIRDYVVQKAITKKEHILVCLEGKQMTLSPDELKKGKQTDVVAHSAWDRKTYSLIDYKWQPNVPSLFEIGT